jgi:uncharacterized protein YceK
MLKKLLKPTITIFASLYLLSGCSLIFKTTGDMAFIYSEEYALPYTLTTDDTDMSCDMADAMTPTLLSFGEVTSAPHKLSTLMHMLSGSCVESEAKEEELSYLRAINSKNISEAKDARIRQKRLYALAAKRQFRAYKHAVVEFGQPGGQCPKLEKEDEIFWVMGLLAGVQSVMSDMQSQGQVGVPADIAMKSVRGMKCVNNARWFGIPVALQAAVWAMMPDSAPEGVDPWKQLEASSVLASSTGVRLAHALEAIVADGAGDEDRLRSVIRKHAESIESRKSNRKMRMMDKMATEQIVAISDRLWTEATGSRTPIGEFGTFWDDEVESEAMDIDDLLD